MQSIFGFSENFTCDIPRNSTISEVCQYLSTNCNELKYAHLKYYYCSNIKHPIASNFVLWSVIIFSIVFLFLVLGLLASDYLVPNLSALSDTLKMDEKLSGLTLLAFANGSPDILSTYIAMEKGMTSMAVGELLGSANFVLTVVIGVLSIYKPFKVNQKTFMRDLFVFSILILCSLLILSDGIITIFESIILCFLYIIFITFNFFLTEAEYIEKPELIESAILTINSLTQENINRLPNSENFSTQSSNNLVNHNNESDDHSINSNQSYNSNGSMNDYYFAHNIDNLEQGRGYKIALLDSLKLAKLFKRKSSKIIPVENMDIERLNNINELSPLHSPKSSQILEFNNYLNNNPKISVNENYTTIDNNNNNNKKKEDNNNSPALSRTNSSKKLKNKDEYQILYPHRPSAALKFGSSLSIKDMITASNNPQVQTQKQLPVINIEPFKGNFDVIAEEENDIANKKNKKHNDSITNDSLKSVLLYNVYDDKNNEPVENNNDFIIKPDDIITKQQREEDGHTQYNLRAPSPMVKDYSSSSSLIPYVEYQKTTSLWTKICPIQLFTESLSFIEKLLAITVIPLNTIFNLIIPVPIPHELQGEIYKHEISLSAKLFHIQIGLFPIILFDFEFSTFFIIISILLSISSFLLNTNFNSVYESGFPIVSSIVGFLTVLKLITYTAAAIIVFLKNLADIYNLSESILGLTILSLGNSIGDVVTNLALAGLGRPLTGLHACFGSPLLYILLGIGGSSLIVQFSKPGNIGYIEFTVDKSLKLTAISIFCMLLFYIIILPINGWIFQRWMGFLSVSVWFILTIVNFVLNRHA
jgi:Ca2+/Na+ antiporter